MKKADRRSITKNIAVTAMLTALVVALQFVGQFLRFGPFSISLVLVPIVIGGALGGWKTSTWLGLVFSVIVLLTDASAFLAISVWGTVVTVMLKGALAGLLCGITYKLLEKKNRYLAVIISALVCPIVNTGIFLLGCVVFFFETIESWGLALGFQNAIEYMFLGLVGINFLIELATNVVLAPTIVRLINVRKRA